jgi:hypothetical protein
MRRCKMDNTEFSIDNAIHALRDFIVVLRENGFDLYILERGERDQQYIVDIGRSADGKKIIIVTTQVLEGFKTVLFSR